MISLKSCCYGWSWLHHLHDSPQYSCLTVLFFAGEQDFWMKSGNGPWSLSTHALDASAVFVVRMNVFKPSLLRITWLMTVFP